jgi:hypothetical protein
VQRGSTGSGGATNLLTLVIFFNRFLAASATRGASKYAASRESLNVVNKMTNVSSFSAHLAPVEPGAPQEPRYTRGGTAGLSNGPIAARFGVLAGSAWRSCKPDSW